MKGLLALALVASVGLVSWLARKDSSPQLPVRQLGVGSSIGPHLEKPANESPSSDGNRAALLGESSTTDAAAALPEEDQLDPLTRFENHVSEQVAVLAELKSAEFYADLRGLSLDESAMKELAELIEYENDHIDVTRAGYTAQLSGAATDKHLKGLDTYPMSADAPRLGTFVGGGKIVSLWDRNNDEHFVIVYPGEYAELDKAEQRVMNILLDAYVHLDQKLSQLSD